MNKKCNLNKVNSSQKKPIYRYFFISIAIGLSIGLYSSIVYLYNSRDVLFSAVVFMVFFIVSLFFAGTFETLIRLIISKDISFIKRDSFVFFTFNFSALIVTLAAAIIYFPQHGSTGYFNSWEFVSVLLLFSMSVVTSFFLAVFFVIIDSVKKYLFTALIMLSFSLCLYLNNIYDASCIFLYLSGIMVSCCLVIFYFRRKLT